MLTPAVLLALLPLSYAAVTDLRRRIIPDTAVLALFICAALNVLTGGVTGAAALCGALATGAPLLLLACRRNGLGGGDVKLCAALGALFGVWDAPFVLLLAFPALAAAGKLLKRKALPLAPFLLGGTAACLLLSFLQDLLCV